MSSAPPVDRPDAMCRRRRSSILNRILHHPTPCADGVVLACLCGSLAFSRNLGVVSSNQLLTQSKPSINRFFNNIEKHIKRLTNIMPRKHKSFSWRRGQLQFVDGVGKGMYRCGCFATVRMAQTSRLVQAIKTNLACRRAAVCGPASATPCADRPWHRLTYAQNDAPVKHRHTRARMHARERAQAVPQAAQGEQPGSVGPQQGLTFLTYLYLQPNHEGRSHHSYPRPCLEQRPR